MALGVAEQIGVERTGFLDFLGDLVDENYLVEEPAVDLRDLIQLINGGTQVECLLDCLEAVLGRNGCGRAGKPSSERVMFQENPVAFLSMDRMAFWSASVKLRPMAIASPTDFMVVVSRLLAAGNFSKAKRGILHTT